MLIAVQEHPSSIKDLTNLGAVQVQASGSFYRDRYIKKGAERQILGMSPDQYKESQLWASAPDQSVSHPIVTCFNPGLRSDSSLNRVLHFRRTIPTLEYPRPNASSREVEQRELRYRTFERVLVCSYSGRSSRGSGHHLDHGC